MLAMQTNKTVARPLSRLVQANRNRKEGYRKVYHYAEDAQMKRFCNKWFSKSLRNISTISAMATDEGWELTEGESLGDKTVRLLTDVRLFASALTKKVIIHYCESREHEMLRIYDEVLDVVKNQISTVFLNELMSQRIEILIALDELNQFAITKGYYSPIPNGERIPMKHLT
jgi:hypothetical protein